MDAVHVLEVCQQRGISLTPRDGKLVAAPSDRLTDDLRQAIRAHKPEILAALAHEDAAEYVSERFAICEVDGLPACGIRPVFEYRLSENPSQPLIMLAAIGDTLAEATISLRSRFGTERVLSVRPYVWPPVPGRLQ